MRWIHVEEDLPPEDDTLRWCYSEVFQSYHPAKWMAARGWVANDGSPYTAITHWSEIVLDMPFDEGEFDEAMAQRYKITNMRRISN